MAQMNDGRELLERAVKQKDPAAANELLNRAAQTVANVEKTLATVRHLMKYLQSIYTLDVKKGDNHGAD